MRILLLLILLAVNSCEKKVGFLHFTGTLEKQGMTTYQYGTHVISNGSVTYALRSQKINLDLYKGKTVEILGTKIEGYPIESGPEYLEVEKVIQ